MNGINKVILVGFCGQDPEVRYTQEGNIMTQLRIATHYTSVKSTNNESPQTHTEWHNITCFKRLGEIARDHCHKGATVYIEGRLQTENWSDKNNQPRRTTKIVASTLLRLSPPKDDNQCAHVMTQTTDIDKQLKLTDTAAQENEWDDLPF